LTSPPSCLTRHVPAAPRREDLPPAVLYTDASTDFGLGAVLLLPLSWEALFLRVPARGAQIDFLEVEAVLAADSAFGDLWGARGYAELLAFVDNNCSLAWITRGCSFRDDVDPLLETLWLRMARRPGVVWWERVPSIGNVADLPSRGYPPDLPSAWSLREVPGRRFR
jgi:hypothetical protein